MDIRVLVVDDSEFFTEELSHLLRREGGFEIAGKAGNGLAALELADALRPDLVTLDVRMPIMDGVTTLRHIMIRRPVATVMISSFTTEESHLTFECLRYGAVDFVTKPSGSGPKTLNEQKKELADTLRRAASVPPQFLRYFRMQKRKEGPRELSPRPPRQVLVVMAGRSGLMGVAELLHRIPPGMEMSVIVSLDLPPAVVESFSLYLARFSTLAITAARADIALEAAKAYLVPTSGPYLMVKENGFPHLRTFKAPAGASKENLLEALYKSVAEDFEDRALGILFSGGAKGALAGLAAILDNGGTTFAQSPESASDPECLASARQRNLASHVGGVDTLTRKLFTELLHRRD